MTAQEVFDTVVRHLHTQGKPARSGDDSMCEYRTMDGLSCAVGCLISDEEYNPDMEGMRVCGLIENNYATPLIIEHQKMLGLLQNVHDSSHYWQSHAAMGMGLQDVARIMNLDDALVKELYNVS